jgi:hypothetical protein
LAHSSDPKPPAASSYAGDDPNEDFDAGPGVDEPASASERDYIIPARDARGESIRVWCRAMPAVGRLLSLVIASKRYPFRLQGDVVRWCIVTGVKRLLAGAGVANSDYMQMIAMNEILVEEEYQIAFRVYFNRLRAVVDHYREANADGEARRVVSHARGRIIGMQDGYWKDRHLQELLTHYGTLLDADGVGADFGGGGGGGE